MVKNPPADAGDVGLIPGLGRSRGGGNGSPLQYSCLGNSTDTGAWGSVVHGVANSQTRLNTHSRMHAHLRAGVGSFADFQNALFSKYISILRSGKREEESHRPDF